MSNEEMEMMFSTIQWAEKKHRAKDEEDGVRLSLTKYGDGNKSPRLKIFFGKKCGEVTAAKYARYSALITDDGAIPEIIIFEFSVDKKSGPSWYKVCKGGYIEPALTKDEVQVFNEVWKSSESYELHYNERFNRYFIKAKEAR